MARGKISTARALEQHKRQRNARSNVFPEFSNEVAPVEVEDLSKDLLVCTKCGERKPDEEFNRKKGNVHRRERYSHCKKCSRKSAKKHYKKLNDEQREKRKLSKKKDYEKHKKKRLEAERERKRDLIKKETPEQREKRLLRKKKYYYRKKDNPQ